MNAFIIELDNRPGSLADVAAAIAEKGINITGVAGATAAGSGSVALVTNDEGATRSALQAAGARSGKWRWHRPRWRTSRACWRTWLASWRTPASTSRRIFPTGMEGGKITVAFAVDNVEAARSALGRGAA